MADELTRRFEAERPRLRRLAARILSSTADADDVVQEAWLRLTRVPEGSIEDVPAWLTTVVTRLCLDALRSRTSRRETLVDVVDGALVDSLGGEPPADPFDEAVLTEAVDGALGRVLDLLSPAERVAFVLHDVFALPFEDIGAMLGRSGTACRQLASRARRRVQHPGGLDSDGSDRAGGSAAEAEASYRREQQELVTAFLAASREGDLDGLLRVLDPDAVVRADGVAVQMGSSALVEGAEPVARVFCGRAIAVRPAILDGYAAAAWFRGRTPRVVFAFTVSDGLIREIELIADPEVLAVTDVAREW